MLLTKRLEEMRQRVRAGEHHRFRQSLSPDVLRECETKNLSWMRRVALLTSRMCEAETPIIEPDERIIFTRTVPELAPIFSREQRKKISTEKDLEEFCKKACDYYKEK